MNNKLFFVFTIALGMAVKTASAAVDPSYVKIKLYEGRVSQNADCSSSIRLFVDANPPLTDVLVGPTLGSGAIPNGTYKCFMFKMSDNIHFQPASAVGTHGACNTGSDYVTDVAHDETAIDPDGTSHATTAGVNDIVWVYFRVGGGNGGGGAFRPDQGLSLASAVTVSGDSTRTMVFNFQGAVDEGFNNGAWECGCNAPNMSFR